MLDKLSNTGRFVFLMILLVMSILPQSGKAEQKPSNYYNNLTPQMLIELLNKSKDDRKALSVRNSIIGQKAPPIKAEKWLRSSPDSNNWPTGKVTVLEFWSIYCGPCVASLPKNKESAYWLSKKGGVFLSVHAAEKNNAKILEFLNKHSINYPVAIDSIGRQYKYFRSETFEEYGINGIPTYVTIGKNGQVLSCNGPTKHYLEKLLSSETIQVENPSRPKEANPFVIMPDNEAIYDVKPRTEVNYRFLVYRPETPELVLQEIRTSNKLAKIVPKRYSNKGQTIYEIFLSVNAPNWGQVIKDEIVFVAKYGVEERLLRIPYDIKSRELIEYPSSTIYLGLVHKDKEITRNVTLQASERQNDIKVKILSLPPQIKLEIDNDIEKSNKITVRLTFSSQKIGVHKNIIKLLAFDNDDNEQLLELKYCAIVHQ